MYIHRVQGIDQHRPLLERRLFEKSYDFNRRSVKSALVRIFPIIFIATTYIIRTIANLNYDYIRYVAISCNYYTIGTNIYIILYI